ncbi:hypothetical protein CCACVL1_13353 [Corchorus capsularis]|uniref:Uncharacterized protein n=1 Tax=Corchorus capsularis TaxID=210143 RepID=A0A1R3IB55_COCAP|nr:hypothetical protein CCACVL1_13353 [Corchorus capsularis]
MEGGAYSTLTMNDDQSHVPDVSAHVASSS